MTLEKSGIYTIPCEVNGLKLRFIFDTGSADVHLSLIEAAFMYKNGYITDDDFIGTGKYSMADGSVAENAIVNLRQIKIGNKTITNVTACVSSNIDASLLLGQSAINKLGNYSIEGSTLVLNGSSTNNQFSSSTTSTSTKDSIIYDINGNTIPSNFTGKGKKVYSNGDVYEGEYVKGKRQGHGVYTFTDGESYEGDWYDDHQHGRGIYCFANGNKYEGFWYKDFQEGSGIMYYHNGDVYNGEWKQDMKEGKGILYYANGNKYDGEFYNGTMSGRGTFTWASGDKYIGNFKDGYRNGYGTYYWKDGDKYTGYWLNGKKNGEGTYYYASGGSKKGIWKDGEFVSSSSNSNQYTSTTSSNNDYVNNSYNSVRNRNYSYDDDDYDDTFIQNSTSGYSSSQSTTYEDVDYYLAQVTTDLNLREGPGTDYGIVSRIPRGDFVFLSTADAGQSFRKVLYIDKNIFGYVSKNYLTDFRKVEEDVSGNLQIESHNSKTTADIKIENRSNKTATIAIGSSTYTFSPYQTRTIKDIKPGRYKTMASSPGVIPYVGLDIVAGGYIYSWVFYIKTVTK